MTSSVHRGLFIDRLAWPSASPAGWSQQAGQLHTKGGLRRAQARVQGLEAEVQELRQQLQVMQLDRTNQQAQLDQLSRVALRTIAEPPPPPTDKKVRLGLGSGKHVISRHDRVPLLREHVLN
jgi:hypothetical protein